MFYFMKIFLISLFLFSYGQPLVSAEEKIVAVVNNEIVTQKDLDGFLNYMRVKLSQEVPEDKIEEKIKAMKLDLLQRLIEDKLILQEAKKNNIKIDQNRVKGRINEIRKAYNSDREFQASLIEQGLTEGDLAKRIQEQMENYAIIEAKVKDKVQINPTEITDYYNKNIADFGAPEQREFISISSDNKEDIEKVYDGLKKDKDIKDLQKEYSLTVNTVTAKKNVELRKEFEDAVFNIEQGIVSKPVKVEDKFYIFKVIEITPPQQLSLAEAQNTVYSLVLEKKMQEGVVKWLEELKKKAYIKIVDND